MKWLELFAGGGGVATGLETAGHEVSAAIEMEPAIAACYHVNHPHTPLFVSDLREVALSALPNEINATWASPVCKQDSKARNKTLARREDAAIGLAILPYLKAIQPELFILENVGLYRNNPAFTTIVSYLIKQHYTLSMRVLNAADYGIPQHRDRLILQARRGPIAWPEHTGRCTWYNALCAQFPTMEQAELAPWQQQLWKPEYDTLRPVMVSGQYSFRDQKGDPKELEITPAHLPARTVTSSHNNTHKRIVLEDRILRCSPRESARLQSFPDSYIWPERVLLAQEIIGNAVPPMMVEALTKNYVAREMECVA